MGLMETTPTTAPVHSTFTTDARTHVLGSVLANGTAHEVRCSCGKVITTKDFPSQSAAMCRTLGWRHLDYHARLGATVAGY
jgi:hypothetical protein